MHYFFFIELIEPTYYQLSILFNHSMVEIIIIILKNLRLLIEA